GGTPPAKIARCQDIFYMTGAVLDLSRTACLFIFIAVLLWESIITPSVESEIGMSSKPKA
ncbi:hypothetical protein, partial [Fischerella thermalis]|uniref:hypothetical protein n=1 Tax=Fischerella thermalis TaxID=372787 RepID=UPI000CC16937